MRKGRDLERSAIMVVRACTERTAGAWKGAGTNAAAVPSTQAKVTAFMAGSVVVSCGCRRVGGAGGGVD